MEQNRTKRYLSILKIKIKEYYRKCLIDPNNRKLKNFHLLFFFTLIWDFLLSGFIWSNYKFHLGEDNNFMNHEQMYMVICTVQIIDIFLNFLKIKQNPTRRIDQPKELFDNYIKSTFVIDLIAVLPYSNFQSDIIYLRYLKLINFDKYLGYMIDNLFELISSYMNVE